MIILEIDQTVQNFENLSILTTPRSERMKRAIKSFVIFFTLFIISIFIPVLHFFLCPLFLGLAIWQFLKKFNEKYAIDFSKIHCPRCNKNPHSGKAYAKVRRFKDFCPNCRYALIVRD